MDFTGVFKSEVFRPVATYVIPGFVATIPYVFMAAERFPSIAEIGARSAATATVVLLMLAVAAGMVLEMIGARIEAQVWDPLCEAVTDCHSDDWHKYLASDKQTPIAQDYLLVTLLKLKFELAMGLALIASWWGVMWLDAMNPVLTDLTRGVITMIMLGLASYLLWESGASTRLLGNIRHLILHGEPLPEVQSDPTPSQRCAIGVSAAILTLAAAAGTVWALGLTSGAATSVNVAVCITMVLFAAVALKMLVVPPAVPISSATKRFAGALVAGAVLLVLLAPGPLGKAFAAAPFLLTAVVIWKGAGEARAAPRAPGETPTG